MTGGPRDGVSWRFIIGQGFPDQRHGWWRGPGPAGRGEAGRFDSGEGKELDQSHLASPKILASAMEIWHQPLYLCFRVKFTQVAVERVLLGALAVGGWLGVR